MTQAMALDVNGRTVTFVPRASSRRAGDGTATHLIAIGACVTVALCVLLIPSPAAAALFPDIGSIVNDLIVKNIMVPILKAMYESQLNTIHRFAANSILTAGFEDLMVGADMQNVSGVFGKISDTAVTPIATTFFSLVMMAELLKIAQRVDQNATLPLVKEVFMLFTFCAIYLYLIQHGYEIMGGIYNLFHTTLGTGLSGSFNFDTQSQVEAFGKALADGDNVVSIGTAASLFFWMIIESIVLAVAYVITLFKAWALAIQVYLLAAFAPLAFAFLGNEHTRTWALGYVRNFMALALSGIIMLLIIYIFPIVYVNVANPGDIGWMGQLGDAATGGGVSFVIVSLKSIAACVLLISALNSAQSWAQGIFGGN